MSDSTSPSSPPAAPALTAEQIADQKYLAFAHKVALGCVVACPLIALLPPRKLDLYTYALGGTWVIAANHLYRERSGRHLYQISVPSGPSFTLPTERSRQVHEALAERRRAAANPPPEDKQNVIKNIWMGDEKEGWQQRRLEEERKALEEGKGYGDLIMEQIREVWYGKGKGENKDGENNES